MRETVHPIRNLLSTQDLREGAREVIAVVVHQVVAIATELVAQLLHNPADLFRCKVRTSDLYALAEPKLFAQFVMIARLYLKDAREGEWMAAVCKLRAKDLHA